ncbi:MAG: VOC family protein [Pseudomonadota bacterium]
MKLSPLVRTAIITANLDKARDFYQEVLGLTEVFWEGELNDPSVWHLLGAADGSNCRAVILKVPNEPAYGMVGLFELSDPEPPSLPPRGTALQQGEGVLVFYCSDLDYVVSHAERFGGAVIAAPINLVHEGLTKQREMGLRDPDGHAINLIEWDPANDARPELTPGSAEP